MPTIDFTTKLFKIDSWTILLLPQSASAQLPSRGQTMAEGTINGAQFRTPLEPDGRGSHWFRMDNDLLTAAKATAGDSVTVSMESSKNWPEPKVPADVEKGLAADPKAHDLWIKITPMARWDWLRWIGSTKNADTRAKHIAVARDKLRKGMRRPCCFNRTICTDPYLSKNGTLLGPS